MSRAPLTIKNYTSDDLKSLLKKNEKFQQGVRLYACYQVSKGQKPKDLQDFYETSFKSICNWVNKLNEGGVEALIDKEKPGRSSRLSILQKSNIKTMLLNTSPSEHGYNSATWTGLLLIDWVEKNYQITYKKAQIYNILKNIGLTFQKGKGFYPEAKNREEKVDALKKTSRRKRTQ